MDKAPDQGEETGRLGNRCSSKGREERPTDRPTGATLACHPVVTTCCFPKSWRTCDLAFTSLKEVRKYDRMSDPCMTAFVKLCESLLYP